MNVAIDDPIYHRQLGLLSCVGGILKCWSHEGLVGLSLGFLWTARQISSDEDQAVVGFLGSSICGFHKEKPSEIAVHKYWHRSKLVLNIIHNHTVNGYRISICNPS